MNKVLAVVVFVLLHNKGRAGHVEPRCSKYDFEEKVLEKVLRFEHKMELFTDSIDNIAAKVEENLERMHNEQEKLKSETNAEWLEIKSQFGSLKRNVEEQTSTINGTIYSRSRNHPMTLQIFQIGLYDPLQQSSFAFSAYDLSAARPSTGNTLIFSKTQFNDDGLYSTNTGKYTTPADGIYVFHSTLTSNNANRNIHVEFKAGGNAIGRFAVIDTGSDITSSGSAVARLNKGTDVFLRVTSASSGYKFREDAYYMNSFSGFRISE